MSYLNNQTKVSMKKLQIYITYYRKLRKISQKEMADELNMSQRNFSRIENGEVSINLGLLNKIAHLLNVSPGELLGITENNKQENSINENERQLYRRMIEKRDEEINDLKGIIKSLIDKRK